MDINELKNQAENLIGGHASEVEQGVEKVAEMAKDKVGHEEQIDAAVDKIKDFLPGN